MTTPNTSNGHPPVVSTAAWQAARNELMEREKSHMREGDSIAAARRRLPMVEVDGTVEVVGVDGSVAFIDLFQGRDVLLVHKHMWHDGIPIEGQCMGCTLNTWHIQRAGVYLRARGVSLAVATSGPWDEVAPFVEFMGYTEPWYSVRENDVFPEEFLNFLSLPGPARAALLEQHADLFHPDFWRNVQRKLREGETPEVFPYRSERRLVIGN